MLNGSSQENGSDDLTITIPTHRWQPYFNFFISRGGKFVFAVIAGAVGTAYHEIILGAIFFVGDSITSIINLLSNLALQSQLLLILISSFVWISIKLNSKLNDMKDIVDNIETRLEELEDRLD